MNASTTSLRLAMLRRIDASVTAGAFAGIVSYVMVLNAAFYEAVTASHVLVTVVPVLMLYMLICPRVLFPLEAKLYAAFFIYGCISTLWAPDLLLAMNSLEPMLNFLLLLILFSSLVSEYPPRAVITGALLGFLAGGLTFTAVIGFPFYVPPGFSYNGVAVMYLYGVFLAVTLGATSAHQLLPLLMALLAMLHVAATTSIKTNFGVLLGAGVAALFHLRDFGALIRRHAFLLVAVIAALTYWVVSTPSMIERLKYGMLRMSVGIQVLQAREDVDGYVGFGERIDWARDAYNQFLQNPLFGEGVEAFRFTHGITSHSTVVDLAYNMGALGIVLFYAVFASVLWRTRAPALRQHRPLRAVVIATVVCYLFVSLSGTFFYNTFTAASLGICVAMLRRAVMEAGDRKAA